jgi:hypothetical protein
MLRTPPRREFGPWIEMLPLPRAHAKLASFDVKWQRGRRNRTRGLAKIISTRPFSLNRVLWIAGCASLAVFAQPQQKIWWAKDLNLMNLSDIDQALGKPFDERISVASGSNQAQVGNCFDYLKYSDAGYKADSDFQMRMLESLGADCRALALLKDAAPARVSYLQDFRLDTSAPAMLPAQFAIIVSNEEQQSLAAAAHANKSWLEYQPKLKAEQANGRLTVDAAGMRGVLRLYARGDFNGDGVEDLLIREDYAALGGTYSGSRLFLLTRRRGERVLQVLKEYD